MTNTWKWKLLGVFCGLTIGVVAIGAASQAVVLASHKVPATTATLLREDCGPDKGKCSGTGHCCLIGGSGWCCPKDQACGEEIGDCKPKQ
jgi:hypothetical protein